MTGKTNILRYGKETPLPEQIPLRAGMLTMVYEDGDLRSIKQGEHELVRRIYCAVRDRNWGTVLPVFSDVQMDIREEFFPHHLPCGKQRGRRFSLPGGVEIAGDAQGTITFRMDGQASSTFLKNCIGFCVLHPAGGGCVVYRYPGGWLDSHRGISTRPEPRSVAAALHGHGSTSAIRLAQCRSKFVFVGHAFEMEDQRNWTWMHPSRPSAPRGHPYPVEIHSGLASPNPSRSKSAPASVVVVSPGWY